MGRACTKPPRLASSQEVMRMDQDGEKLKLDGRRDWATRACTGHTQLLDFLPNAPEEHCVLELRDGLQVYRDRGRGNLTASPTSLSRQWVRSLSRMSHVSTSNLTSSSLSPFISPVHR